MRVRVETTRDEDVGHSMGEGGEVRADHPVDAQARVLALQENDGGVEVRARDRFAPCLAPEREPGEGHRGLAILGDGELERTAGQGIRDDREHGLDVERRHVGRGACSRS